MKAKRFENPAEITKIIDHYTIDIIAMSEQVNQWETSADKHFKENDAATARVHRELAIKMRKRIKWRELRCKRLGELLAELQTMVLPGVNIDNSVEGIK